MKFCDYAQLLIENTLVVIFASISPDLRQRESGNVEQFINCYSRKFSPDLLHQIC